VHPAADRGHDQGVFAPVRTRVVRNRVLRDRVTRDSVVRERVQRVVLPDRISAWIEAELGSPVASAVPQAGGISPGPAARLQLADGRRYFIKAVSASEAPYMPRHFRLEIDVLRTLPTALYRPSLIGAYDDDEWVAIVLEDVEGTHPNLSDPAVWNAAREVVRAQTCALTPDPVRLPCDDVAATVRRWHGAIAAIDPVVRGKLPHWWRQEEPTLLRRLESLADRMPPESWCHFDVRDDNMLVRDDGTMVVLDWGMSRSGPAWMDEVLLGLHDVTTPLFDERVAELPAYAVGSDVGREDAVTDYLLCLGISLAAVAYGASPVGLPRLMSQRRAESHRLLVGAARRLGYR
jgi:aminoglycoside phosphotransferase (APT) family kinase protein